MDWIAAALQTFGRTLGIDDLALDDEGLVAFTFEDGGELALQDLHPLGGNEFLVSLAKPGAGDTHRVLRAALAAADHRRGHPWAVQVGLDGGDLLVTLRLPRSALMPSSLEEAVVRVQRFYREVALGF